MKWSLLHASYAWTCHSTPFPHRISRPGHAFISNAVPILVKLKALLRKAPSLRSLAADQEKMSPKHILVRSW